jgi:hypothetical protein
MGYSPDQAYAAIGAVAGDDGVMATPDPSNYERTCSDLQYALKSNIRNNDDTISFLGRIYPKLFEGSPESFFDPGRALGKLHLVANSNKKEDPGILACQKLAGYIVTDKNNFLGHIASHIYKLVNPKNKSVKIDYRYGLEDSDLPPIANYDDLMKNPRLPIFQCYTSDPVTLLVSDGKHYSIDPSVSYLANQLSVPTHVILEWYKVFLKTSDPYGLPPLPFIGPPPSQPDVCTTVIPLGVQLGPKMGPAPDVLIPIKPVCRLNHYGGKCKRGDKCRFIHDKKLYCIDFIAQKCTRGPVCKYPHCPLSGEV